MFLLNLFKYTVTLFSYLTGLTYSFNLTETILKVSTSPQRKRLTELVSGNSSLELEFTPTYFNQIWLVVFWNKRNGSVLFDQTLSTGLVAILQNVKSLSNYRFGTDFMALHKKQWQIDNAVFAGKWISVLDGV